MDAQIINKYFPDLTANQRTQFGQLGPLYQDWNQKVNVISRKDIGYFYERHVLHSLAIAKLIQFSPATRVLDIGTGGGFPGLPLAIMFPEAEFHLVDSIGKKVRVAKAIAEEIGVSNCVFSHSRVEEIKGRFDFITARAVAQAKVLHAWASKKLSKDSHNDLANGFLLLKGGDLDEELAELRTSIHQISISSYFEQSFFETKQLVYFPPS